MKKAIEKASEDFQQRRYTQDDSWKRVKTNDSIIYKESETKKHGDSKKIGDYVDYEEID